MTLYKYKALNNTNKEFVEGTIEAQSMREARLFIKQSGLLPVEIKENSASTEDKTKKTFLYNFMQEHGRIHTLSLRDKIFLTSELKTLLSSGIPIIEALTIISSSRHRSKNLKLLATGLLLQIKAGSTLRNAFEMFDNVLDAVYIGLASAGEASGNYEETFSRLLDILQKESEMRFKIQRASIYPTILLIMAAGAICVFGGFVLPVFASLAIQNEHELPLLAQSIIGLVEGLKSSWHIALIFLIGSCYGIKEFIHSKSGKEIIDKTILYIPKLNNVVKMKNLSNYISVIGVAYDAGMPIIEAADIAADSINNTVLKAKAKTISQKLKNNSTLYKAFIESEMIDKDYVELINAGEKTGETGKMLKQLSATYDAKVDMAISVLTNSFEPLVMLVIGIIVAYILAAVAPLVLSGGASVLF